MSGPVYSGVDDDDDAVFLDCCDVCFHRYKSNTSENKINVIATPSDSENNSKIKPPIKQANAINRNNLDSMQLLVCVFSILSGFVGVLVVFVLSKRKRTKNYEEKEKQEKV